MMLRVAAAIALATTAHACGAKSVDDSWHSRLVFQGRSAAASLDAQGYQLSSNGIAQIIPHQPATSTTASVLFDALFALAQRELEQARVSHITDSAFNDGKPLACECLQTGEKWTYVWTRDLAYATDLALFRFDPQRARNGLEFKLSAPRLDDDTHRYVVQDTGSGGSWPISTDRIVWFLGARQLTGDATFDDKVYKALVDTLAQDRVFAFDMQRELYRGETSFLDWREQSYPAWTATDVGFIAESFALSTNVLHYQALQLATSMAKTRNAALATQYEQQAAALKSSIDRHFWREDRGLYMSYIGGANAPETIEAYDLLGTSLTILSGVAPADRARRALGNYPTYAAGSPVIWPEHRDAPIYHNRAIWPFVSAYALKAARALDEPTRIAHELRSIVRGAALAGSNMENYEVTTQAVHVDDGERSGPVANSRRQLWSVAAYLNMVVEGVFGLTERDTIEPKIPRDLLPMLFGDRDEIHLDLVDRRITLVKPPQLADEANLLVADSITPDGHNARVQLRGNHVASDALSLSRPLFAPATPKPAQIIREHGSLRIVGAAADAWTWYLNGRRAGVFVGSTTIANRREQQCVSLTRISGEGVESLPSKNICVGDTALLSGRWPRAWTATRSGRFQARLNFRNAHGPINTGITAAVKMLVVACDASVPQHLPIVMPHSDGTQASTAAVFTARARQRCEFSLDEGFNMSFLAHYAHYTDGEGGARGMLDAADIEQLQIVALP